MKKYLLLLLSVITYGQTYQNPTYGTVTTKTNTESATATKINVQETSGLINWLQPINIPIPIVPTNYTVATPTLGAHLTGIDNKLGTVTATTAGISTRVWFTADQTTITAGTFDLTNATSKGTAASHVQSVTNDDNQKKYYTTDLIGTAFATATLFPPGTYAGNLSASTTPNSAQQRWTVELYKCDTNGTPIASGVAGAAVGSLGVTMIVVLDSGLLTLADGSVTNVQVSGVLPAGGLSMAVGQRIRYHVSAEKVGTAASNITQSVYYGTSYNSFLDVPVPLNTSGVQNLSTVAGQTTTEALNNLKASIPVVYSTVVYVNNTNPNAATIFDDVNPPVVNDNSLKANTNNLYVASDNTGWVYNSTSLLYVTKPATAPQSNFYVLGTTIDAGSDKTQNIERLGAIKTPRLVVGDGSNASPSFIFYNETASDTGFNHTTDGVIDVVSNGATKYSFSNAFSTFLNPIIFSNSISTASTAGFGITLRNNYLSNNYDAQIVSITNAGGAATSGLLFRTGYFNGSIPTQADRMSIDAEFGIVKINNLAGTGTRQVVVDASGNLSANNVLITITTSTSITTATLDANSVGQDGHHVIISNGVNAINLTCNGGVTTSYGKVGTGAITFVQGSGRTLVQLSGTAILSGIAGSTATLWSNGTTDYLAITNY